MRRIRGDAEGDFLAGASYRRRDSSPRAAAFPPLLHGNVNRRQRRGCEKRDGAFGLGPSGAFSEAVCFSADAAQIS